MQKISITIDDYLKDELDTITAKGERAAFITEAIKKAVDDWHKQRALEKILTFKPYKINQDSVEVLREVREGRVQQVIDATRE
jgi:metal-responsive CopG/Arc/MetJ family transcriptional regulator